jgi:hypothetical protein
MCMHSFQVIFHAYAHAYRHIYIGIYVCVCVFYTHMSSNTNIQPTLIFPTGMSLNAKRPSNAFRMILSKLQCVFTVKPAPKRYVQHPECVHVTFKPGCFSNMLGKQVVFRARTGTTCLLENALHNSTVVVVDLDDLKAPARASMPCYCPDPWTYLHIRLHTCISRLPVPHAAMIK